MRRMALVCGWLLLFALTALAATPEDEIMKADRDFNKATQEKRAEGWLSYFALDDAALTDPPTVGRQAITERYQKLFSNPDFTLTWDPDKAEVFPGTERGWTSGKYVARFKSKEGQPMESTGRYLTVWDKQKDGSWKIIADSGAPDGPPRPVK
jgi:ketosteroid isomerase-like protein